MYDTESTTVDMTGSPGSTRQSMSTSHIALATTLMDRPAARMYAGSGRPMSWTRAPIRTEIVATRTATPRTIDPYR